MPNFTKSKLITYIWKEEMFSKRKVLFILLTVLLTAFSLTVSLAQDGYGEAPQLAEMVAAGDLPQP